MKKFYDNIQKAQVKVGLFTVIILLVLVVGYLWLSSRIALHAQKDIRVSFEEIMGLEIGDKAMFRGMEVGRIKNIVVRPEDILVTAKIRSDVIIKEGARFYITDSSLMGGTALNISQGSGTATLDMKLVQKGDEPTGVMNILSKASGTIAEINGVLSELRSENGVLDKSKTLLNNAGSAAKSVDALAVNTNAEIASTLGKIEALSEQVRQVVDANASSVNSVLSQTPGAMSNLNSTLDSLQVLSSRLGNTIDDVNQGKGTAGRLLTDEQLYGKLLDSITNLDLLVQDIKTNPKKYLKFSLF